MRTPIHWRLAEPRDIETILDIAEEYFEHEISHLISTSRAYYASQIDLALTKQRHNLALEQVTVAEINQKIVAYAWISRGQTMPYSQDELAEAKILHLRMDLPLRTRLEITTTALVNWENWAKACGIPVLISASIRQDQRGFMRLHERMGYTVRGSIGYKRLH